MVCDGDVRVARIDEESFIELVLATRPVFDRLMATVRPVVSKAAQREANRERLAALGTMAAGLAHELNNPAAAAKRAAADLAETLVTFEEFVGKLVEAGVERGEAAKVVHLKDELLARARSARRRARWRPPTPRTSCSTGWRSWASRTPGEWSARSPPPAPTTTG